MFSIIIFHSAVKFLLHPRPKRNTLPFHYTQRDKTCTPENIELQEQYKQAKENGSSITHAETKRTNHRSITTAARTNRGFSVTESDPVVIHRKKLNKGEKRNGRTQPLSVTNTLALQTYSAADREILAAWPEKPEESVTERANGR